MDTTIFDNLQNLQMSYLLMSGGALMLTAIGLYVFYQYVLGDKSISLSVSRNEPKGLDEKRRARRVYSEYLFRLQDIEGSNAPVTRLVNLSPTGACMATAMKFRIGERIKGRVRLSKEKLVEVTGQVVWSKRRTGAMHYGLAFETVHPIT